MPLFDYTASDREGALSHGQIEGPDRAAVSRLLAKQGLFVMGVTIATKAALPKEDLPPQEREPEEPVEHPLKARLEMAVIDTERTVAVASISRLSLPQRTWSPMDRALYLRQLQVMFEAGIPLYRSAAVLADNNEYNVFVNAKLKEVPLDLERGRMLSKALQRSGLFTPLIVSSVRLGEESGRLDSILHALSDTEERAVQLKRALVSRLTYPAVVLVAMSLGLLILGHVMSRVLASMPALQKSASPILSALSGLFQNAAFLPMLVLVLGLAVTGARRVWRRHRFRLLVESALLRAPLCGPLLRRLEANSVTGHLALLIKAGLPLDRGLGLCADLVRTLSFRRALLLSQQDLRNGEELAPSLKQAKLFPEDVLALVQAGEIAGSLEDSLDTASRYCAEQVERTLESALAVLEPLLIGLLGIAIGAVLILTFVPIFSTLKDL
jgi:type IV pilus assembly protein PilC